VDRVSRTDAPPQLARVLAMIPWLVSHRGAPKREIAERFRISLAELEADLALIMMIGVPPYSPGDYINVSYDGDTVDVWLAPYFTRPLQLTPSEGLALLAGGRALLAVDGSDPAGPLATAVAKLEVALGVGEVVVDLAHPPHLGELRAAARAGHTVEIDYWSGGRDELTTRRIDPGPPFFALGEWYTDAYCHLREGTRMFRVDRIRALRPTDATFAPAPGPSSTTVFHPRPDDPRVTLDLPPTAAWVAETAPVESVEDLPDGGQRVVVAVSERAWLERTLLHAGPDSRVLAPPEWRDTGRVAARRVLDRYA
jgi:proteasome accessory factor C